MAKRIEGKVTAASPTGDLLTDIGLEQLAEIPNPTEAIVACGGHETLGLHPPEHCQPDMTFVALMGNSGHVELVLVGDSASEFLGIRVGSRVVVRW